MFKSLQWEDWMGIALGAWMLASPWVLGYADNSAAVMNALVLGAILVLEELLELGTHETAEEWIDLAAGIWLVVSPFALGFSTVTPAAVNAVAVGLLTALFAASAMSPIHGKLAAWWEEHVAHS